MKKSGSSRSVGVHLTNVAGAGATQLLLSLLPAMERDPEIRVTRMYLPSRGELSSYISSDPGVVARVYRRVLPNSLSRILECTLFGRRFEGADPLLVLGDLPLRCRGPQTVFVQNSHLLRAAQCGFDTGAIKYWVSRFIFRLNSGYVRAFIVQTEVMRAGLLCTYPSLAGRVHVVSQPVPSWLLESGLRRTLRADPMRERLHLIYPAAAYPHKNHKLLARIVAADQWPVEKLLVTLGDNQNPAPHVSWIECSGFLSPQGMLDAYAHVDAIVFLSKSESYGFPLVEAMFVGLPIVCVDLPYARSLCGDQAFYFDPDDPESLRAALLRLQGELRKGFWPDWGGQLERFPRDWRGVARQMLKIACGE